MKKLEVSKQKVDSPKGDMPDKSKKFDRGATRIWNKVRPHKKIPAQPNDGPMQTVRRGESGPEIMTDEKQKAYYPTKHVTPSKMEWWNSKGYRKIS